MLTGQRPQTGPPANRGRGPAAARQHGAGPNLRLKACRLRMLLVWSGDWRMARPGYQGRPGHRGVVRELAGAVGRLSSRDRGVGAAGVVVVVDEGSAEVAVVIDVGEAEFCPGWHGGGIDHCHGVGRGRSRVAWVGLGYRGASWQLDGDDTFTGRRGAGRTEEACVD